MKKIVVGIDLSDTSELALGHAVEAARRIGAEVVMVMVDVVPEMPAVIDPGTLPIARNYHQELAARLAADHRALAALRERWNGRGAELSMLMVDGYADERLTAVAAEVNAELIVVGSHGRTGARRFLLGSVAEHVVRLAGGRVLVARGDAPAGGYRRVVLGTDLGATTERAFEHALELLAPGAQIELVHAWSGVWTMPEAAAIAYDTMHAAMQGAITDAAHRITELARTRGRDDLRVQARFVEQNPSHALTEIATEVTADLVIVGSHGRRGVRRLLLGSVAETTVRHAPCSVLVSR